MSKTWLAKKRFELYNKLSRNGFFKYIASNLLSEKEDNAISKFFDFTPDFIKRYVGESFALYKNNELSQEHAFNKFYSWYLKYANLRLDDNITIERIDTITSEEVFNRPSPIYLSTVPLIRSLASKLLVYALIPFVEPAANVHAIVKSISNWDSSIFRMKFINTAAIIFNRYTLMPDIYGLIEGLCTTHIALSIRYTDHNRIDRNSPKEEADARRLNTHGIEFFKEFPHLRTNIGAMYNDQILQYVFMGNKFDMCEELLRLCKLLATLSLQACKECDHTSIKDISIIEDKKYTKLYTLLSMYKLSGNGTNLQKLITNSLEIIINSPLLYQKYEQSPSRVKKNIQDEIIPKLYKLVQEIRSVVYQEAIEVGLGVLPPENSLYFAKSRQIELKTEDVAEDQFTSSMGSKLVLV